MIHVVGSMLGCLFGILHIARRNLHRLRCNQHKNGQNNVFHNTIIHPFDFSGSNNPPWKPVILLGLSIATASKPQNQAADREKTQAQGDQVINKNAC